MDQSPAAILANDGHSPSRKQQSPGVVATLPGGRRVLIPRRSLDLLSPAPTDPSRPYDYLWIFDSGWGGVGMVVALAKQRIAAIVHIKNSFAGFPMKELEDQLRGMPGGSHLEMRTTVDGIPLIAMGAKFNSKKTCFFCCPVGAAPTTPGEPYVTKFPDADRNVHTRNVDRPALSARYFINFNAVDVHDQRRQAELALEQKWVAKGEHAGKFRMATTIFGITVIDTLLAMSSHSHPNHALRYKTTKDFAESLASEMVDNVLDGKQSRPVDNKRKRQSTSMANAPCAADNHKLASLGKNDLGTSVQLHCVMCKLKATTYCTAIGCGSVALCQSGKRTCHADHCSGVPPPAQERRGKQVTV
jgi:hypothetical protein